MSTLLMALVFHLAQAQSVSPPSPPTVTHAQAQAPEEPSEPGTPKGKAKAKAPPPPPSPTSIALCQKYQECLKANPAGSTMCVRDSVFAMKLVPKKFDVSHAKDMGRVLRREGFIDREPDLFDFNALPEGAILVLDSHDPIKDKKPHCPKVYGNVLMKCNNQWFDGKANDLDFHMRYGCRTKGIWVHPGL